MAKATTAAFTDPHDNTDQFEVDVLVIGGGTAGQQAAQAAAQQGVRVLVVDSMPAVAASDASAQTGTRPARPTRPRGVLTLWGHTALELLVDLTGAVRGASGIANSRALAAAPLHPWRVQASAVVVATREGLLMAAEAGAQLTDMDTQGGLRALGANGATTVTGLYAAGHALPPSGEALAGTAAAGRLTDARRAGQAAAALAPSTVHPGQALIAAGRVGLRGPGHHPVNPQATCAALHTVLVPAHAALNDRAPGQTAAALARLDALWHFMRSAAPAPAAALQATREAATQLAVARWRLRSQMVRSTALNAPQQPILSGGLDMVWAHTAASIWMGDHQHAVLEPTLSLSPPPQALVAPRASLWSAIAR